MIPSSQQTSWSASPRARTERSREDRRRDRKVDHRRADLAPRSQREPPQGPREHDGERRNERLPHGTRAWRRGERFGGAVGVDEEGVDVERVAHFDVVRPQVVGHREPKVLAVPFPTERRRERVHPLLELDRAGLHARGVGAGLGHERAPVDPHRASPFDHHLETRAYLLVNHEARRPLDAARGPSRRVAHERLAHGGLLRLPRAVRAAPRPLLETPSWQERDPTANGRRRGDEEHDRREREGPSEARARHRRLGAAAEAGSFSRQKAMFFTTRSRSFAGSALPERSRWLATMASL